MKGAKLREQAKTRVMGDLGLVPFAGVLLAEYPEGDAHYRWLLKESYEGIIEWVKEITPKPKCSICRRRHGLEVIHACE